MVIRRLTLTIHVNDLSVSKAFYADLLGLPIVADEEWESFSKSVMFGSFSTRAMPHSQPGSISC